MKWCSTTSRPASTSTRCGHLRLFRRSLLPSRGCRACRYTLCMPVPSHSPRWILRCTRSDIPTAFPEYPPCELLICLAIRPSHFFWSLLLRLFLPSGTLIDGRGVTGPSGRFLQVNFRKNVTFEEPSGRPGCDFIGVNHYARCPSPHFDLLGWLYCRRTLHNIRMKSRAACVSVFPQTAVRFVGAAARSFCPAHARCGGSIMTAPPC